MALLFLFLSWAKAVEQKRYALMGDFLGLQWPRWACNHRAIQLKAPAIVECRDFRITWLDG